MTEDETDVLHGRNDNVRMKMSSLIKQESMVLLHTNEATKTKEDDLSWFLSFLVYSALLFLSTSIFGQCVCIILYVLYVAVYVPGLLLVIARRPEHSRICVFESRNNVCESYILCVGVCFFLNPVIKKK